MKSTKPISPAEKAATSSGEKDSFAALQATEAARESAHQKARAALLRKPSAQ